MTLFNSNIVVKKKKSYINLFEELGRHGANIFTCARTAADLEAAVDRWTAAGLQEGVGGGWFVGSGGAGEGDMLRVRVCQRGREIARE